MPDFVELPIGQHDVLKVEVAGPGLVRAGLGESLGRVPERLDDAVGKVIEAGKDIITKARAAVDPPESIELELGLKLTAKTGFLIAESSGEAQFKVTLRWALAKS